MSNKTLLINVTGLVQGVGFRPFVYRIAVNNRITGWVQNTNENVRILVSGMSPDLDQFLHSLKTEQPRASMVEKIMSEETDYQYFDRFDIIPSHDVSNEITEISPDIAVCEECMGDTAKEGSRLNYAFVNCINCGPRFTIIRDLPYDRSNTTMQPFPMCPDCLREYETISDRRFHAQPTACALCGPHYTLFTGGKTVSRDIEVIVDRVARCLEDGGIALVKGLGGMHLACDALSEDAVGRLRDVKKRDGKPFAVMFRDMAVLKQYAVISEQEEQSLLSWRRPIVLVSAMSHDTRVPKPSHGSHSGLVHGDTVPPLAEKINQGLNLLGAILPYMPLHYQLFRKLKTPALVLTSGNFSNEPILIGNDCALSSFSDHVDAVVLHNRDIYSRTDDSVIRVMGGIERLFRRSRGYVPAPVATALNTDGILALGAELTNCFCIGKGCKAILSQHIGDLQDFETTRFYHQAIEQLLKLFRVTPTMLAVDMHPDYTSTKTAQLYDELPLVAVQHHHAHIASCMAEHRLREKVIGVAFDGTGYGDDGNSWGSEFFICDLNSYRRITHFEYIPLPGGDKAAREPWRTAVSLLYHVFGMDFMTLELPLFRRVEKDRIEMVIRMIDRNVNCPLASGAGRLFDAVASITGVCHFTAFQAEPPMRLESLVIKNCSGSYPFDADGTIRFGKTVRALVSDMTRGEHPGIIATKFHNTIISVIFESVNAIREKEGINKVVLSGGVFQNRYLAEGTTALMTRHHFEVYSHAAVPANDGGIALGQLAVASERRDRLCV